MSIGLIALAALFMIVRWGSDGLRGTGVMVLLCGWLEGPLAAARRQPSGRQIIGVVKAAVLGIVLFDAAFVTAARGLGAGAMVAALFVPAYLFGRRFQSA